MPACRETQIDIEHIDDWVKVKEHRFKNLIALCPNCHRRVTNGEIDKIAVKQIKANLSVLNHRYSDLERRILQAFANGPHQTHIPLEYTLELAFSNLLADGYLVLETPPMMAFGMPFGDGQVASIASGPAIYRLTPQGRAFIGRWLTAKDLAPTP